VKKKGKEAAGHTRQGSSIKPGTGIILGNGLDRLTAGIKASSIAEPKPTKTILDVVARLSSIFNHE
jgi:hypothetical protein